MDALLTIRNLSYQKNHVCLFQNLNLTINPGEILAVYGGVNAGKTALVDIIAGFAKPNSGQVARVPDIAVVTQQPTFYPDLTVKENIEFSGTINNYPEDGMPGIIEAAGLTGWENVRADRIPAALKPMLQLACALTCEFDLLLLDEVTAGLDTHLKQVFWKLIGKIRDAGKGILLTTGLWGDANRCDDVIGLPSCEMLEKETSQPPKKVKKTSVPAIEKAAAVVAIQAEEASPEKEDISGEVVS